MNDRSTGSGWWKASDGRWYPPPRPANPATGSMPDAPRAAVQPPVDPAARTARPTRSRAPSHAQFGSTATLPSTTAGGETDDAPAPTVSRASFGWRPARPATAAPATRPVKPSRAPGSSAKSSASNEIPGPKQPISNRNAVATLLGVVLIVGGGVTFWIGHNQQTDTDSDTGSASTADVALTTPTPPSQRSPDITAQPPFSAPAPSVAPDQTLPTSSADTLAGQAVAFERSLGPAGAANLATYRSALAAFGDAIPLENGDPATYGVRIQAAATDVFNAATAVLGSLSTASVGPLVQPFVADLRRTLDQVSAASNVVAGCDPTQPCGPDILTARSYRQDAYLAVTILDDLTP